MFSEILTITIDILDTTLDENPPVPLGTVIIHAVMLQCIMEMHAWLGKATILIKTFKQQKWCIAG